MAPPTLQRIALHAPADGLELERFTARLRELGVKNTGDRAQLLLVTNEGIDTDQLVAAAGPDGTLDAGEADRLSLPRPQAFGIRWPTSNSMTSHALIGRVVEIAGHAAAAAEKPGATAADVLDALQRFSRALRPMLDKNAVAYATPAELASLRGAVVTLYRGLIARFPPEQGAVPLRGTFELQALMDASRDVGWGLRQFPRLVGPLARPLIFSLECGAGADGGSVNVYPEYAR